MLIKGRVKKTVYKDGFYSIKNFESSEYIEFPNGSAGISFSIKGYFIPGANAAIEIEGEWDPKPANIRGEIRYTFCVKNVKEIKIKEKEDIIYYLQSIDGIGEKRATLIYNKFREDTYEVLDVNIDLLRRIPTISKKVFERIKASYLTRGAAKELFSYLYKYNIANKKIESIFKQYREFAIENIKKDPYGFYLRNLLTFKAAEAISKEEKLPALSDNRIKACVCETLRISESQGHTYLPWKKLVFEVVKLLKIESNSEMRKQLAYKVRDIVHAMNYDITQNEVSVEDGTPIIYLKNTAEAEYGVAKRVKELTKRKLTKRDYLPDIKVAEKKLKVQLSDEQEAAVQMVLNSPISIVTGGPGTGKTTFQQVLLEVYNKYNAKKGIRMGAPTGRAARRMTESSGIEANTLHQILGLTALEEGETYNTSEKVKIKEGLMVVDEASMLDIFLTYELVEALSNDTQIVFIGDIYQLPSVGAGSVLKSFIECGVIPTTKFTKIFRQAGGSTIAQNAIKINQGIKDLEFDNDFNFIEKNSSEEIVEEIRNLYYESINEYGRDEVCVLTPFRKKTKTGVNEINPVLKQISNPLPKVKNRTNKIDGQNLFKGDKVMFTKNIGELTNGDIGYITDIKIDGDEQVAIVDFEGDRRVELIGEDMKFLVPAYSISIHKSQGSEYKCCIIVVDKIHKVLLKRNLIYTAITRAKSKVYLVGSKEALNNAIDTEDTSKRYSQLAELLKR